MARLDQPQNSQQNGRASVHPYVGRLSAFLAVVAWPTTGQWSSTVDPKSMGRLWIECPQFSCPTGLRRVQRKDFRVYGYNWCVDTGNHTEVNVLPRHRDWDPDDIAKARVDLIPCCFQRDICLRICGIDLWKCHREYHACVDKLCNINDENDTPCQSVAHGSSFASEITFPLKAGDLRCWNYTNAQKEACECVEESREGAAVKEATIDFYKQWNPKKLTKNGKELKEKKLLKEWKGKRPEMFLNLWKTYKSTAVEVRDRWTDEVVDPKQLQSKMGILNSTLPRDGPQNKSDEKHFEEEL